VTLDDLERRSSCNRRVISPNSVAIEADYLKVVEYTPIHSAVEMYRPKNLVFGDISFMALLVGDYPSGSVEVRRPALASENLTNNQP